MLTTVAMSELKVFNVVQSVLAESLGLEKREVWLPLLLRKDLNANEHADFLDIAWRFNRLFKSHGIEILIEELESNPNIQVADVLSLICKKLSAA